MLGINNQLRKFRSRHRLLRTGLTCDAPTGALETESAPVELRASRSGRRYKAGAHKRGKGARRFEAFETQY
jgi:hypothetical protein